MRHLILALALAIVGASAGVIGSGPEQRVRRGAGSQDNASGPEALARE